MNAVLKTLDAENFFTTKIWVWTLSIKKTIILIFTVLLVVISSFFVIYVQDVNRRMINELQIMNNTQIKLQLQWNQLLLEKSALISPTRIQKISKDKFAMHAVGSKKIVTLQINE